MRYSLVLALALAGCMVQAQRTRAVLGPELSQAEVKTPPGEIDREIVRLFASRGYALVDVRPTKAGRLLYFKGNREAIVDGVSNQLGSSFAVSIEPAGEDHALVSIDGAPLVNGIEACAPRGAEPCGLLPSTFDRYVNGSAEAAVVHGVFSELTLEDLVVGSGPRQGIDPPEVRARKACQAERHRALVEAAQTTDQLDRMKMVADAPTCL